jgi:hypothetical protein
MLGLAVFCGFLGALSGQPVHAQTPNSTRFVQLLLFNQTAQIQADTKAVGARDSTIAKLDAATSSRQIKQLGKMLSRLNHQILGRTAELQLLSIQTYNTAAKLSPSNSSLRSAALANLVTVQQLSAQVGLGFTPATPTQ